MDQVMIGLVLAGIMLILLASGVWVSITLLTVGFLSIALFSNAPAGIVQSTIVWGQSSSWALTAMPLFIWMGEILYRTDLTKKMFRGLAPWLAPLPGRLLHVNVAACAIFAAVSGSSAATTATVGKITIPELLQRGYDEKMTIGSLAGASTLGLLIPPSIILIVYGVAANLSISRLFIAGILPGIMMVCLFMGFLAIWAFLNPQRTPPRDEAIPFFKRVLVTANLLPVVALMVLIIGSIYVGLATATEAAAMGVTGALLLAAFSGSLNWTMLKESALGAMQTTCMVTLILSGAAFLSVAMGYLGIPRELAAWVGTLGLSKFELLLSLTLIFIIMGCFLDGISLVVLTAAVIMPMIQAAGVDPIWFGIYIVIVVEMSQITPPVGINLFVLQSIVRKDLLYVSIAAAPFFLLLVVATVILILFPEIATYLPSKMN